MADHGEMLPDRGIYLKNPHFYASAMHVPFIMAGAGINEHGRRIPELVELTDLAPMLCDLRSVQRAPGYRAGH